MSTMRILCLHGIGTNAQIFDAQTTRVTAELRANAHEFVFVDGLYEFEASNDIRVIYPPPYLSWFESPAPRDIEEALEYIQELVDEEGPFDGIMGFSQGGCLASSFILHCARKNPANIPFKFGIFLCSLLPYESKDDSASNGCGVPKIRIPTLHVIGKTDPCVEHGRALAGMCEESDRTVIEHVGGHEMPRKAGLNKEIANAISLLMGRVSVPAA